MPFPTVDHLLTFPEAGKIFITQNIPEAEKYPAHPKVEIRVNKQPKGYGGNHNAALRNSKEPFICVLNPDILFTENLFPKLLACFDDPSVALVAPRIISPEGRLEDSAREFPALRNLAAKACGWDDGTYKSDRSHLSRSPDWIAGMFMMFRADVFREIGGFDEKFFLYYEDVDICWRLRQKGYEIKFVPTVEVIHDARRESRKNWRYARWHLASMARYLIKARAWW